MEDKKDKEWADFKGRFYKILWTIFVLGRVPVILVWLALLLGMLIRSFLK